MLNKCQSQPNHQPASGSICCPACLAPVSATAREDEIALLMVTHGTVLQRSQHFPCAHLIVTPGLSLETPAESQRAFLLKCPLKQQRDQKSSIFCHPSKTTNTPEPHTRHCPVYLCLQVDTKVPLGNMFLKILSARGPVGAR